MHLMFPESPWSQFFDDLRLPADALLAHENTAISQMFTGLNPERLVATAAAIGQARFTLGKAAAYAKEPKLWGDQAIATHQAVAHPLAQTHIEIQMAKLMLQKAATLYDDETVDMNQLGLPIPELHEDDSCALTKHLPSRARLGVEVSPVECVSGSSILPK